MPPAEAKAQLIALWNAGIKTAEIARRLGIPRGTVQSRAHRLQQQGTIQPRPRSGNFPRRKAPARQEQPPAPASHPRVNIKQWTLRLSRPLIDAVKAEAMAAGKEPSHLV